MSLRNSHLLLQYTVPCQECGEWCQDGSIINMLHSVRLKCGNILKENHTMTTWDHACLLAVALKDGLACKLLSSLQRSPMQLLVSACSKSTKIDLQRTACRSTFWFTCLFFHHCRFILGHFFPSATSCGQRMLSKAMWVQQSHVGRVQYIAPNVYRACAQPRMHWPILYTRNCFTSPLQQKLQLRKIVYCRNQIVSFTSVSYRTWVILQGKRKPSWGGENLLYTPTKTQLQPCYGTLRTLGQVTSHLMAPQNTAKCGP